MKKISLLTSTLFAGLALVCATTLAACDKDQQADNQTTNAQSVSSVSDENRSVTVENASSRNVGDSYVADVSFVSAEGTGMSAGTVTFTDTPDGLEIKTDLQGLKPGEHGFHVHEKGDCAPSEKDGVVTPAGAAGEHYDPAHSGKHLGPEGGGHAGDLPVLNVAEDGTAKVTMTLRGVKAADFKGRSIMIHQGGDNYSDEPLPLGGGGARVACGVIK